MKAYAAKLKPYFEALAAKSPAPGGGSAAAAIFCAGAACIEMAMNYSLREKRGVIGAITRLRRAQLSVVDNDGKLFARIMKAKGPARDRLIKESEQMIVALGMACLKTMKLARSRKDDIKKSIFSDYIIGFDCLRAALSACMLNLRANEVMFKMRSRYIDLFENEVNTWPTF